MAVGTEKRGQIQELLSELFGVRCGPGSQWDQAQLSSDTSLHFEDRNGTVPGWRKSSQRFPSRATGFLPGWRISGRDRMWPASDTGPFYLRKERFREGGPAHR